MRKVTEFLVSGGERGERIVAVAHTTRETIDEIIASLCKFLEEGEELMCKLD